MKHPVLVGVINALIPGTGYLILKERVVFGSLLLAGLIASIALMLTDPSFAASFFFSSTTSGKALEGIASMLFVLAFGYDAYALAKEGQGSLIPTHTL